MPNVIMEIRVREPGLTTLKTFERYEDVRNVPSRGSSIPDLPVGTSTFSVRVKDARYPMDSTKVPTIILEMPESIRDNEHLQLTRLYEEIRLEGSGWRAKY